MLGPRKIFTFLSITHKIHKMAGKITDATLLLLLLLLLLPPGLLTLP
jgi:hypothetical protein